MPPQRSPETDDRANRRPRRLTPALVGAAMAVTALVAPFGAASAATADSDGPTPGSGSADRPASGTDPAATADPAAGNSAEASTPAGHEDDYAWDDTPPAVDPTPAPPVEDTPTLDIAPRRAVAPRSGLADEPVRLLNANGGWCWWQTPRVIVTSDGEVLAASTPSTAGTAGRGKATDIASWDLARGEASVSTLMSGRLASDDHNSGALLELPSGRVVTAWAGHSQEPWMHVAWRDKGSATWTLGQSVHRPESSESIPTGGGFGSRAHVTYANLLWVQQENGGRGRLYNFFRGRADQPVVMVSDDEGSTWSYLGEVFVRDRSRPYPHYAAGPDGKIWFSIGLGHPHAARFNPVYSGYLQGGMMFRSDGTYVTSLGSPVDPSRFTTVFQSNETKPVNWGPPSYVSFNDTDAWGSDLQVDASGAPVMTFSVRKPERTPVAGKLFAQDAYWARLDPATSTWTVSRLGHAGSELYETQLSYTGLSAIDPTDPYRVYLSTDVDPVSGTPLISSRSGKAQHEIWEGTSADGGGTWTWAPVTANSATDNLRPSMGAQDGSWALLWLRGRYTNFVDNYDQDVVGIVRPDSPPSSSGLNDRTLVGITHHPIIGDFDGDGADDVFNYGPGAGADNLVFTRGDGERHGRYQTITVSGSYSYAVGDIDVNGVDDVVWYAPSTGATSAWMFQPGGWYRSKSIGTGPRNAQIRTGDFDGNGTTDVFFYRQRESQIWLSKRDGSGWVKINTPVGIDTYRPIVGDFNGDGASDIAWYRPGGAPTTMWLWRPWLRTYRTVAFESVYGAYANVVVADFDGDGRDDIWFPTAGGTSRWLSRGDSSWSKTSPGITTDSPGVLTRSNGSVRATLERWSGLVIQDRRTP